MSTEYDALVVRAENAMNSAAESAAKASTDRTAVEQLTLVINNEQAVSIQNSKEAIRQAIIVKGQSCDESVAFSEYANKVLAIEQEGDGVDTSNDTVTADKMLLGITAHDASGIRITGTINNSTPYVEDNVVSVPKGYISDNKTYTVAEAGEITQNGNVITVPKGYISDTRTITLVAKSLPNLSIALDSDSGRITATYSADGGYYNGGTVDAAETMDVQVATEYTPGTSDIIIPAYKFLTGAQTIKGEPTLVAENIPSDMNFFGIQGTRKMSSGDSEGSSCKFYECVTAVEEEGTPEVKAGITVSGDIAESAKGFYEPQGDTSDLSKAMWYNGKTYIYKCSNWDFWVLSPYTNDADPSNSYFYGAYSAGQPPWEVSSWECNTSNGTMTMTGTLTGSPAIPGGKFWSGYEWLFSDSAYSKSATVTDGLSWTTVRPEIGKTYTEDALVEIASLYQSEDNGGTEEPDEPEEPEEPTPEEPEEPVEPEQPEASFGTYLQISGSTAVNEGLDGIYELNESTATDIHKEWIKKGDSSKKVNGNWEEVDNATLWGVYGGSGSYYASKTESSISYPWNADNSSLVWRYYSEPTADFHVTPYESDEEDPSTGGNGSDEPTVETTINSFTITGASEYSEVNGTYTKTSDTSSKTGPDAQYSMKSGDNEYLCYYTTSKEWRIVKNGYQPLYYSSVNADNPWDATTWYGGFTEEKDSSIKVEPVSAGTSGGGSSDEGDTAIDGYIVSGAGSTQFNGTYVKIDETHEGEPLYVNENGCVLWQFTFGGGLWYMNDSLDNLREFTVTFNFYGSNTSDVTGTWEYNAGDAPAPTVKKA